jgi:hypothetical protein
MFSGVSVPSEARLGDELDHEALLLDRPVACETRVDVAILGAGNSGEGDRKALSDRV